MEAHFSCLVHRFGGGLVTKSCLIIVMSWTVTRQAPLSTGFSRQAYWSGLPFRSPRDLPDPGIKPRSPALQAGSYFPGGSVIKNPPAMQEILVDYWVGKIL